MCISLRRRRAAEDNICQFFYKFFFFPKIASPPKSDEDIPTKKEKRKTHLLLPSSSASKDCFQKCLFLSSSFLLLPRLGSSKKENSNLQQSLFPTHISIVGSRYLPPSFFIFTFILRTMEGCATWIQTSHNVQRPRGKILGAKRGWR